MTTRAVFLDALGTLVALEDPTPALVREMQERHGIAVAPGQARAALRAEMAFYRTHHDETGLADLRMRCAHELREALPPARDLPLTDVLETLLAALHFFAYPEVPGVLAELRGRGLALVVVSNWDVSLHGVLARTELMPLLDAVLTSAEVGVAKPQPEIFERALELAGATADEAIHVGDSPAHDVAGALAAGIEPVLLVRESGTQPPVPDLAARDPHLDLRSVTTLPSLAGLPALAT